MFSASCDFLIFIASNIDSEKHHWVKPMKYVCMLLAPVIMYSINIYIKKKPAPDIENYSTLMLPDCIKKTPAPDIENYSTLMLPDCI